MKVTTSCYNRFWIFDEAYQLQRLGVLHRLINDYPKFMTRRWQIADDKVTSLLLNGIYGRVTRKVFPWVSFQTRSQITHSSILFFAKRLPHYLPLDSDIFIGLTTYSLETIERAKQHGITTLVERGSFHPKTEFDLLREECQRWGGSVAHLQKHYDWVIARENAEYQAADHIMVLSNPAKKSMIAEGIPAEKVFVNQCGVDLQLFQPAEKQDTVFRVIQCGGIDQRKGVPYLLQAFSELKLPNSELWFIGGGLETSNLQSVIQKYRADNIVFKGGFPQQELAKLYTQGSVLVLASITDGFGMVVPQAMACGLPVVVTENVGASDLVTEGENGFIVPIRKVEALKEKLLYLYEHQQRAKAMGLAAYQAVKQGQTWDDYGERLVSFLKRVHPQ
ncbi:glycosyltransferase family 4 protein [Beggiatoa leptomitoformis]|uniref:Glycosyltransferase n=1 Tax=Beggiatoa leptomitoformis TaxID=288004 RepID=A0A650GE77_9GAMM|nr:glycosyltransferase family 4 protein [Beggiatoa leptomitoformis]ALG68717.1 glycosyltransferase [Beggiatoa leptomitoformis]QGX04119.1 glycosyltransferase [Beggiatoa leptomitoformis]